MVAVCQRSHSKVGWLWLEAGLVGWQPSGSLHFSSEPCELPQCVYHGENVIKSGMILLWLLAMTFRVLALDNNHVTGEAWHLLMKDDSPYVLFWPFSEACAYSLCEGFCEMSPSIVILFFVPNYKAFYYRENNNIKKKWSKNFDERLHHRGCPQNCLSHWSDVGLIHFSLGPPESTLKQHLDWFDQLFWHSSWLCPTDACTDHGTSVTMDCIFAPCACNMAWCAVLLMAYCMNL